jgi:hypothetical protein
VPWSWRPPSKQLNTLLRSNARFPEVMVWIHESQLAAVWRFVAVQGHRFVRITFQIPRSVRFIVK